MNDAIPIEKLNGYNKTAWCEDYFAETNDKKYGMWFYNVIEQTMGSYYGHLSVFENDKRNLPVLSSGNVWIRYGFKDTFTYTQKSDCLIFVMSAYNGTHGTKLESPFLLIRPGSRCFAFIPWDFTSVYYCLNELKKDFLEVNELSAKELDRVNFPRKTGEIIDLKQLTWHDSGNFDDAKQIYLDKQTYLT